MGAGDTPSVLQPETKDEFAAEAQGWTVADFLEPPTSVENWAPYVEQYQQKGVTALWPADDSNFTPFAQAMTTAGFHPAFVILGAQFDNSQTQQDVAANPTLPPVYVETQWWPLAQASQNPSTEELVTIMHKYAKGDPIDFDDEEGIESWLAVGQVGLGLRRQQSDGDLRAEQGRRHDELGRRRHSGAHRQTGAVQQQPPAHTLFRPAPVDDQGDRLRQEAHRSHAVHLELQPQECRPTDRSAAGPDKRPLSEGWPSERRRFLTLIPVSSCSQPFEAKGR